MSAIITAVENKFVPVLEQSSAVHLFVAFMFWLRWVSTELISTSNDYFFLKGKLDSTGSIKKTWRGSDSYFKNSCTIFLTYLTQFGDLQNMYKKRIISIDMLNVLYCNPENMEGHAHIKSRNTLLDVHSAQAQ